MNHTPCRQRTFPFWLAYEFEYHYIFSLRWLKHFLERLGRDHTLAVWEDAFRGYDTSLLESILAVEWQDAPEQYAAEMEEQLTAFAASHFPVAGVSAEEARHLIDHMPPFEQIRRHFSTLDVMREITTYQALHLFRDSLALIAEGMLARYRKAGELIVYDAVLEEWSPEPGEEMEAAEYLRQRAERFSKEPEEADIHSAGLQVELLRATDSEVVTRVTECEWARYYQEHHPRVGYLLACSADNAAYRSTNHRLRLQRTTTLMERGTECDFRVYDVEAQE